MSKRNFLDHYFLSIYNKLEADALLFNRKLPHMGMVGSENELALSALIRDFLPPRFGVETSGIVIDKFNKESKQCDIIIYDASSFPKYLRKVFPVELVYGVIEVKTHITNTEAVNALSNLNSLFELDFHPLLSPYWSNRCDANGIQSQPPFGMIFAYRSSAMNFETFAKWFPLSSVHNGFKLISEGLPYPEIRTITVAALDKGLIKMESNDTYVQRWALTTDEDDSLRSFQSCAQGQEISIDPAKVLFVFLETLWQRLSQHHLHPGFDIRTYMTESMGTGIDLSGVE